MCIWRLGTIYLLIAFHLQGNGFRSGDHRLHRPGIPGNEPCNVQEESICMKRVKYLTGTLLGIGRLPAAPGTWASFMFLPAIYITIWFAGQHGLILLIAVVSILYVRCTF